MKKRFSVIFCIVVILSLGVYFFLNKNNDSNNKKYDLAKELVKNPRDFIATNNVPISSLATSNTIQRKIISEKLGTPVNNDLGIPDAYLDLIANTISESNINARKAAVLLFYYDTKALLSDTQEEMFKNVYKWSAAFTCTSYYLPVKKEEDRFLDAYVDKYPSKKMVRLSKRVDNNMAGHVISGDYGTDKTHTVKDSCEYFINHQ